MRTIITLPDQLHARAKQHAGDLGVSLSELARRLFAAELDGADPQGSVDDICGMVHGAPFDMATDGRRIIGEAAAGR